MAVCKTQLTSQCCSASKLAWENYSLPLRGKTLAISPNWGVKRQSMAYAIHMEREPEIKLEEWIEAVNSTEGCRINNEGVSAINPNTGEEIHISGNEGDVEVLFQTKGFLGFGKKTSWEMCITFFEGESVFQSY